MAARRSDELLIPSLKRLLMGSFLALASLAPTSAQAQGSTLSPNESRFTIEPVAVPAGMDGDFAFKVDVDPRASAFTYEVSGYLVNRGVVANPLDTRIMGEITTSWIDHNFYWLTYDAQTKTMTMVLDPSMAEDPTECRLFEGVIPAERIDENGIANTIDVDAGMNFPVVLTGIITTPTAEDPFPENELIGDGTEEWWVSLDNFDTTQDITTEMAGGVEAQGNILRAEPNHIALGSIQGSYSSFMLTFEEGQGVLGISCENGDDSGVEMVSPNQWEITYYHSGHVDYTAVPPNTTGVGISESFIAATPEQIFDSIDMVFVVDVSNSTQEVDMSVSGITGIVPYAGQPSFHLIRAAQAGPSGILVR